MLLFHIFPILLLLSFPHSYEAAERSQEELNNHESGETVSDSSTESENGFGPSLTDLDQTWHPEVDATVNANPNRRFIDIPIVKVAGFVAENDQEWAEMQSKARETVDLNLAGDVDENGGRFMIETEFAFLNVTLKDLEYKMKADVSRDGEETWLYFRQGRLKGLVQFVVKRDQVAVVSVSGMEEKEEETFFNAIPRLTKRIGDFIHYGKYRKIPTTMILNVSMNVTSAGGVESVRIKNDMITDDFDVPPATWSLVLEKTFQQKKIKNGKKKTYKSTIRKERKNNGNKKGWFFK